MKRLRTAERHKRAVRILRTAHKRYVLQKKKSIIAQFQSKVGEKIQKVITKYK